MLDLSDKSTIVSMIKGLKISKMKNNQKIMENIKVTNQKSSHIAC